MPKYKIGIVIVGEFHNDPAPSNILLQAISNSTQQQIPCFFCDEGTNDYSLIDIVNGNDQWIEKIESIIKETHISQLFSHNELLRSHFDDGQHKFDQIENIIKLYYPSYDSFDLTNQIMRITAMKEVVKLQKYLFENSIPYFGLEGSENKLDESCENDILTKLIGVLSGTQYIDKRAITMSNSVCRLTANIKKNSIIFIRCGLNHLDQLTRNIASAISIQEDIIKQANVKLISFGLRSPYVKNSIAHLSKKVIVCECIEDKITLGFNCPLFFEGVAEIENHISQHILHSDSAKID